MAVQEQTPYIKYIANGVTQTFATEFDCESKDQLVVMLNGEEPVFTSWSYADKQVTFLIAPVVGTVVELKRQSKLNRTTDYQSYNNSFRPEAINKDLDRIWYAIQEQNYKTGQYDYDYNFVLTQVRPISTGGTGANNPSDARNNLNTYSKEEVNALIATGGEGNVVGVAGGGTGATTAAGARTNLGVMSSSEVTTAIANAMTTIPTATETVAGKAKIATTAIARAGVNDTDIITAKKLRDVENFKSGLAVVLATGVIGESSGCISSCSKSSTGTYNVTLSNPSGLKVFAVATSNEINHPAVVLYNSATSLTVITRNSYDSTLRDTPFTIIVELR